MLIRLEGACPITRKCRFYKYTCTGCKENMLGKIITIDYQNSL
jgi:hypothetical protein